MITAVQVGLFVIAKKVIDCRIQLSLQREAQDNPPEIGSP